MILVFIGICLGDNLDDELAASQNGNSKKAVELCALAANKKYTFAEYCKLNMEEKYDFDFNEV